MADSVLSVSKIFPLYYQISNNELLADTNALSSEFWINTLIMAGFMVLFVGLTMVISRKKLQAEN